MNVMGEKNFSIFIVTFYTYYYADSEQKHTHRLCTKKVKYVFQFKVDSFYT